MLKLSLASIWDYLRRRLRPQKNPKRRIRIVWDIEALKVAREQGMTLQMIADQHGVKSREAARQALVKYHGTTHLPRPLYRSEVARQLECSDSTLQKLERLKLLTPLHYGGLYIYTKETINHAKALLARYCTLCGIAISGKHLKYCKECGDKVRQYRYPFMTPEQKEKHYQAVRNWAKRNPEQVKIIENRANRAYYKRQRIKEAIARGGLK